MEGVWVEDYGSVPQRPCVKSAVGAGTLCSNEKSSDPDPVFSPSHFRLTGGSKEKIDFQIIRFLFKLL